MAKKYSPSYIFFLIAILLFGFAGGTFFGSQYILDPTARDIVGMDYRVANSVIDAAEDGVNTYVVCATIFAVLAAVSSAISGVAFKRYEQIRWGPALLLLFLLWGCAAIAIYSYNYIEAYRASLRA